jgi:gluconokinase
MPPVTPSHRPRIVVLMGVAGSGKTTIGQRLAADLGWVFCDGDDFHPPNNIAKLSRGQPLTDADRVPWLAAIRRQIEDCLAGDGNAVIACSALKESYRRMLRVDPHRVQFVHLTGDPALIEQRLRQRKDHFVKPNLLASQIATLEAPEGVLTVDIAAEPAEIVRQIRAASLL